MPPAGLELLPDPDSDAQEQERLFRRLRSELSELDVDLVPAPALGSPHAPPGSKGADPVTIGAIIVAVSASGGVFTALIETVKDWLGRHAARHKVTMTIDGDSIQLTRASVEDRRLLVEAFVRRHTS